MNNTTFLLFIQILNEDFFLQNIWIIQIIFILIFCLAIFYKKNKKNFEIIFFFFSVIALLALLIEIVAIIEIWSLNSIIPLSAIARKSLLEVCGFCHLLFLPLWVIKRKFHLK